MAHTNGNANTIDIAIIGTGFAGLCMAIQLQKAGFNNFTLFDKNPRLGGTWLENTYPGSGCDVPSMLYSFSFEPKTDWSRKFAEQPEILEYLEAVADKYNLRPHMRLNTEIAEARFDEPAGLWRIRTTTGDEYTANILVAGCGQLNRPYYPDIPGLAAFKGTTFHSARWNHGHDLKSERVAVIGNGPSAIQFIPRIAPEVERLYIFQRSANWIVPKPDREFTDRERKIFTRSRLVTRLYRAWIWAQLESRWPAFKKGGWFGRWFAKKATEEMYKELPDPELQKVCTPDYPIGCKRILISNDYLQSLNRDNVQIVTTPITRVTENGIVTADDTAISVDTIVYATGFQTNDFLAPIEVRGAGDRGLNEAWKDGAEAYLGVAVQGFPNFFILYGPNTNLGHNSIILMIERQVGYVIQCLQALVRQNAKYIDLRPEAMTSFNAEVQASLKKSVWDAGCSSWYKTASGKITNNWPYSTIRYWWRTRHPDLSAFRLVPHSDAPAGTDQNSREPVPAK